MTREPNLIDREILHVSYSPLGGAGRVAQVLATSQQSLGQRAKFVAVSTASVSERPMSHPLVTLAALIDKYIVSRGDSDLFTFYRNKLSSAVRNIALEAPILNLHWLPGVFSERILDALVEKGVPIVWTLHDYRPLTGGCHYTKGCEGFRARCEACPQVRGLFRGAIAESFQERLDRFKSGSITFIAPSRGLLHEVRQSTIGSRMNSFFVPNPISQDFSGKLERDAGALFEKQIYLFVAADVDEPRKGLKEVIGWWTSSIKPGSELWVIGANSRKHENTDLGIKGFGTLTQHRLQEIYGRATCFVFASKQDNAPGVVADAIFHRLPILSLSDESSRWLAMDGIPVKTPASQDLGKTTHLKLREEDLDSYRRFLLTRSANRVAQEYIDIYARLLEPMSHSGRFDF